MQQYKNTGKQGPDALHYFSKYLTKYNLNVDVELVGDDKATTQNHFQSRLVGSIEAAYNLLNFNNHRSSRMAVYVPIDLPQDEQRGIRTGIKHESVNEDDTDIFKQNIVEKYEKREGGAMLTLPDFVCYYYAAPNEAAKKMYRNKVDSIDVSFLNRMSH
ncbi:unnamed protein product [Mucor circinelloides]